MQQVWGKEGGMALAVTLFAVVVVGALVAGALFVGTQEQRMGENQHRLGQSFAIADAGAPEIIKSWNVDSLNRLRSFPRDTYKVANRPYGAAGSFGGSVWKLNRNLYLFDLTGSDTTTRAGSLAFRRRGGGARQRVGILARTPGPLQLPIRAALIAQGPISIGGGGVVDGADHIPNASWTNCGPLADSSVAGVLIPPAGEVPNQTNVSGNPPVAVDPAVADSTFDIFGGVTYAQLAATANVVINGGGNLNTGPATYATGECNKTVLTNWGDGMNRAGPCGSYFPIIHIRGSGVSTTLNGVQGQGILLIDGDLRIQGAYQFFGVVIIKGYLTTFGGGGVGTHFWGMVLSQNPTAHTLSIGGNAQLNFSRCAILDALERTAPGALMRSRSFMALY